MIHDIGNKIKALRNEKGLTQERLVEIVGEDVLSLSTYKRIEEGKSPVTVKRLHHLCRALDCKPTEIIDDAGYLRERIKKYYEEAGEQLDEEELKNIDYSLLDIRLSYPDVPGDPLYAKFKITNLMQFLIYLPLMDPLVLITCLYGIDGDTFEREYYVLKKLEYLYRTIPDSDAKAYADKMAKQCSEDYYMEYHRTSGMTALNQYLLDKNNWEEAWKMHDAYREVIENYRAQIMEHEISK